MSISYLVLKFHIMNRLSPFIPVFTLAFMVLSCSGTDKYLENWPADASPAAIGRRLTVRFLETPDSQYGNIMSEEKPKQITYPDVCTWLGALRFAEATGNDTLFARLQQRFARLFGTDSILLPKPNHVDNCVFGAVPLEIYLKTNEKRYFDLGLFYANSQWQLPDSASASEKAWAARGYTWQTRIWIDDMYMITAVQTQAYRATGNNIYIDRAAHEMRLYLDTIQLDNGLFYHSASSHFCWGRGNGWMAAGMTEILQAMPADHPDRPYIMAGYKKMMATLLKYQSAEGMWRQIIDDPESWEETSSSAMFTYAFITGVKNGWLDAGTYGPAARKAWLSLVKYLNDDGNIRDVCEGTGALNDRNYYLTRKRNTGDLHGQAPMLWCAWQLQNVVRH